LLRARVGGAWARESNDDNWCGRFYVGMYERETEIEYVCVIERERNEESEDKVKV